MPKSRSIWVAVGSVAAAIVFIVGLYTVAHGLISGLRWPWAGGIYILQQSQTGGNEVSAISDANFNYLVPAKDAAWKFDATSTAFDPQKGIVKYLVTLTQGGVGVTLSQQVMPSELKPRGSSKFMAFINSVKATRSQDIPGGTMYSLPALSNGAPTTNSADTVVYATNDILMFGRSDYVVDDSVWAKLLGSLQKQ
jgi:hypothetical protein